MYKWEKGVLALEKGSSALESLLGVSVSWKRRFGGRGCVGRVCVRDGASLHYTEGVVALEIGMVAKETSVAFYRGHIGYGRYGCAHVSEGW